jgi:tripartite-type tricarboxylate transporter receptor subunit TctC
MTLRRTILAAGAMAVSGLTMAAAMASSAVAAWQPTRTVEFIVPAGTGGGADQMARMLQGIVQKHNLMPQSLVVINKAGGAGAEGFLTSRGRTAIRTRSSSLSRTCSRRRWPPASRSSGTT